MFEQIFKRIDDILWKDAGCGSELDYVQQTSWILFLKYLDDLEKDKEVSAELSGKPYKRIISDEFSWEVWACPKDEDGNLDYHKALTGDDLRNFVNNKLFPYLKKFKSSAESADTIEYKIGEIFGELRNTIESGYNLREVINLIDELRFQTSEEKHEMSHLYESKIQNMGNAGRNGGEYYTPRPLIKTIVKIVNPKIGEKVYDGAVGSAGFLVEAFEHMKQEDRSTKADEILQKNMCTLSREPVRFPIEIYGEIYEAKLLMFHVFANKNNRFQNTETSNDFHDIKFEDLKLDYKRKEKIQSRLEALFYRKNREIRRNLLQLTLFKIFRGKIRYEF